MNTIIRLLAPFILLAHICAAPVYPCDCGNCDHQWLDFANSLHSLSCLWDCYRNVCDDLQDLLTFTCPNWYEPYNACHLSFRQGIKDLDPLLPPGGDRAEVVIRLIGPLSGESRRLQPGYLKHTLKMMRLMSLEPGKITLMGTFKGAKDRQNLTAHNPLLNALAHSGYDRFTTVRMAVAVGQVINSALKSKTSLLMLASAMGDLTVVRELLSRGEKVNAQNKAGRTALIFAASEGHPKVVEALLKSGADLDLKDKNGDTAATLACKNGHKKVVKLLGQGVARR